MSSHLKPIVLVSAAVLLMQSPALAEDEHNVSTGVTVAGVPLGVHGVDTVALSTRGVVAEGDAAYTVSHDGVAYYFSSQKSADQFAGNPDKYLPQFGAFCAYAVALGKKFDGDPRFADIVGGKVYLFVNAEIFRKYKEDAKAILSAAKKNWPKIQHKAVSDL